MDPAVPQLQVFFAVSVSSLCGCAVSGAGVRGVLGPASQTMHRALVCAGLVLAALLLTATQVRYVLGGLPRCTLACAPECEGATD